MSYRISTEVSIKNLLLSASVLLLYCSTASAFCFDEAGKAYEINPSLLKSIARTESNMNPKAININKNGSIDIGLMQINSSWIKKLGLDWNELISNPCYNTMTGAKILKQCIDKYGYDWEAVGCYNAVSRQKRVNYSWKIFERLKAENMKTQVKKMKISEDENLSTSQSLNSSTSSLYFRAKDKMLDTDDGHEQRIVETQ